LILILEKNIFGGGSLMNTAPVDYTAGGTIGNPSASIGERGYINQMGQVEQTSPTGRPLRPSVGMGSDPFKSSLDRMFWAEAAQSVGEGFGAGGGGGARGLSAKPSYAGKLGSSGIRPTEPYSYNSGDMAPNPGFAPGLVLSKYKKDQYSGGR
jgi:hypothetical protein